MIFKKLGTSPQAHDVQNLETRVPEDLGVESFFFFNGLKLGRTTAEIIQNKA